MIFTFFLSRVSCLFVMILIGKFCFFMIFFSLIIDNDKTWTVNKYSDFGHILKYKKINAIFACFSSIYHMFHYFKHYFLIEFHYDTIIYENFRGIIYLGRSLILLVYLNSAPCSSKTHIAIYLLTFPANN